VLRLLDSDLPPADFPPSEPEQHSPDIPAALRKATGDPYEYAALARTGYWLLFTEASIRGEWVHLDGIRGTNMPIGPLERGIDIRLDEIVAVADQAY
jgi:hypothetical protein